MTKVKWTDKYCNAQTLNIINSSLAGGELRCNSVLLTIIEGRIEKETKENV